MFFDFYKIINLFKLIFHPPPRIPTIKPRLLKGQHQLGGQEGDGFGGGHGGGVARLFCLLLGVYAMCIKFEFF